MKETNKREHWGSRIGFILATSGAAVGLGNIQRFPYITAQFGGAAFVLVYLLCVLFIGLPLMLVEFAIGRHTQHNPIAAISAIHPKGAWKYIGLLGILTAFFILSYYLVAAGWTISYVYHLFRGSSIPLEEIASGHLQIFGYMVLFQAIVAYTVNRGVKKGIEKVGKVFMPMLLILLLILVVRSLTLPGSWAGLQYYLHPDFSEIDAKALLYAMSQAFFSLCIGEAVLLTYGSYASENENLVLSACSIAFFDTLVAVLSGLILFPAIFAFGQDPNQGVGLIYNVMPQIFLKMPFGNLFGAAFFLLLTFAAFTTAIALLEIPVSYLTENWRLSRKTAVIASATASLLAGLPSLFSLKVYEAMDLSWGGFSMLIGGLLLSLFTGWIWGTKPALTEIQKGCVHFTWQGRCWALIVKYLTPLVIFIILLSLLKGLL